MWRDVSEDEAECRTEMETSTWGFSVSNRPRVGGWSWGANPFLRRGIPVQQSSATSPLLLLLLHPPSALPHMLGSRFVPSSFLSLSSHPPHLPLTNTCAHTRTPVTQFRVEGSSAAGSTLCSTWAETQADSWVTPFTPASFISIPPLLLFLRVSRHSLLSHRPSVHCPGSAPMPVCTELLSPS